jgi:hypothetical protein
MASSSYVTRPVDLANDLASNLLLSFRMDKPLARANSDFRFAGRS